MNTEQTLNKQQKESIFLLQIGTFLEYFDLMLYIHMAVLLNEIFFPIGTEKTSSMLASFAFCSTFIFRPFGALIFGYIGDNYGRKSTVIITTALMSVTCITMATVPTYQEIGVSAAIIVTIVRVIQGLSSMGEIMGAMIYVSEITKPPARFPAVTTIALSAALGSMTALGVATLTTSYTANWRIAFWIGACIAIIGSIARTRLRETPEFADAKYLMRQSLEHSKEQGLEHVASLLTMKSVIQSEKIQIKDFFWYMVNHSSWPFCFYMAYMYFCPMLKKIGFSTSEIIIHNLYISIFQVFVIFGVMTLSKKIYPLFISKFSIVFFVLAIIFSLTLSQESSPSNILYVQMLFICSLSREPSDSILIKHFTVFKRFTAVLVGYALARAIMYIVCSFGLVILTESYGTYGILPIALPLVILWWRSITYYEKLEKNIGTYPLKGKWQI